MIKYQEDQQKVNADLSTVLERSRTLDRDMNALKPEIITLFKQRQQMAKWLRDHGKTREEINELLEKFSLEQQQASLTANHFSLGSSMSPSSGGGASGATNNMASSSYGSTLSDPSGYDEKLWYYPKIDRLNAEKLLKGKPHGTFLIRKSSTEGQYALSIVCENSIEHCIIEKTLQGYGFAEPYNIYASLAELVAHYSQHSLVEHNEALNTTLARPVGSQLKYHDNVYVPMQNK